MSVFYIYLISSLPQLSFAGSAPFSLESFLVRCRDLISVQDNQALEDLCRQDIDVLAQSPKGCLKDWVRFEIGLRNELVRLRAKDKKVDPAKFLRSGDYPSAHLSFIALNAHRHSGHLLESEKILDQERWNFLDQLSFGHYFDFDFLLIYALKLKILERWEKIASADQERLYRQALILN